MPFDISSEKLTELGITAKELASSSLSEGVLTLNFAGASSIEAGKPYLVKVTSEVENPSFEDVTVSSTATPATTTAINFVPTLGKTLVTGDGTNAGDAETVLFLGANNTLYNPTVVNDTEQEASYLVIFLAQTMIHDINRLLSSNSSLSLRDCTVMNEVWRLLL